ncbi:hypothetical protein [Sphingomonas sp. IC-56]|uniref:hypothetical protein n=1 Tax=Sphingomonas sp. IC-56 TaxID=2898529 RepID=UPI001E5D1DC9|nr:hypothetical protein [Sphingomonas sp. IC-56]
MKAPSRLIGVGHLVGEILDVDPTTKPGKARLRRIIGEWIGNGALRIIEGKDDRRKTVKFVTAGEPALG